MTLRRPLHVVAAQLADFSDQEDLILADIATGAGVPQDYTPFQHMGMPVLCRVNGAWIAAFLRRCRELERHLSDEGHAPIVCLADEVALVAAWLVAQEVYDDYVRGGMADGHPGPDTAAEVDWDEVRTALLGDDDGEGLLAMRTSRDPGSWFD